MSNNLLVFNNSEFGKLEIFIDEEGKEWFPAADVATVLGYKNQHDAITKHCCNKLGIIYRLVEVITGTRLDGSKIIQNLHKKYIDKDNLLLFINKSRMLTIKEKEDILNLFNINYIVTSMKETELLKILQLSFKKYKSTKNFYVGNYRIDLYFPDLNLAIECDENNHNDRDMNYEKIRQKFIENNLKCIFIRFNPDDINFNIGDVIYKIISYIDNYNIKLLNIVGY